MITIYILSEDVQNMTTNSNTITNEAVSLSDDEGQKLVILLQYHCINCYR